MGAYAQYWNHFTQVLSNWRCLLPTSWWVDPRFTQLYSSLTFMRNE